MVDKKEIDTKVDEKREKDVSESTLFDDTINYTNPVLGHGSALLHYWGAGLCYTNNFSIIFGDRFSGKTSFATFLMGAAICDDDIQFYHFYGFRNHENLKRHPKALYISTNNEKLQLCKTAKMLRYYGGGNQYYKICDFQRLPYDKRLDALRYFIDDLRPDIVVIDEVVELIQPPIRAKECDKVFALVKNAANTYNCSILCCMKENTYRRCLDWDLPNFSDFLNSFSCNRCGERIRITEDLTSKKDLYGDIELRLFDASKNVFCSRQKGSLMIERIYDKENERLIFDKNTKLLIKKLHFSGGVRFTDLQKQFASIGITSNATIYRYLNHAEDLHLITRDDKKVYHKVSKRFPAK